MKNREWLLKTAEVDVLKDMNDRLQRTFSQTGSGEVTCIMDCLHKSGSDVVSACNAHEGECTACIAAWLNEERR